MASVGGAIGLTNQFQFKETYEKLKEAEQKDRLLQPRKRVDELDAKSKDVAEIMTHFNAIKMAANDIMDNKALGQKNLKSEGESAKVTVKKGVAAMDFSIDVKQLASKDTYQTKALKTEETPIFSELSKAMEANKHNGKTYDKATFTVRVGEEKFSIQIEKSTTLNQLADKLRQAKNDNDVQLKDLMNVKLIDTGKDGFRLMLGSQKSGVENALHFEIEGENEQEKNISKAALDLLGFGALADEAAANELVDKAKELSENTLKLVGEKAFDEKAFKEALEGEELELKTAGGKSFKIDKDTDILSLSKDKLDAFYEHQLRAQVAEWVSAQGDASAHTGVKITIENPSDYEQLSKQLKELKEQKESGNYTPALGSQIDDVQRQLDAMIAKNDPADFEKTKEEVVIESAEAFNELLENGQISEEVWADLKNQFAEAKAEEWLKHLKDEKLSDEVQIPGASEPLKLGEDGESDWSALSDEQKQAVIKRYSELRKEAFSAQAGIKTAESKLTAAREEADKIHIQRAADAKFSYEGITITRPENEIKDIIIGAEIKLVKEGKSDFKIAPDSNALLDNISKFMSAYNSLINNINAATDFDKESNKAKGTLMGVSEVQSARAELTRMVSKFSGGLSLHSLGIELNRDGIMQFSTAKNGQPDGKTIFKQAYEKNAEAIDKFLLGGTDYEKISFTGKKISAMPVIASGDLVINDVKISLDADFIERLNSSKKSEQPSMKEYRDELVRAINDADIEGVKASISDAGELVLESDGEHEINIGGLEEKLLQIGLKETTVETKGKKQRGIFDEIAETIKTFTGTDGTLTKLEENLKRESKNIQKDMDKIKEDIDKRFDGLRDRLGRYDTILNKLDNQSRMIDGMMKAAFAEKK